MKFFPSKSFFFFYHRSALVNFLKVASLQSSILIPTSVTDLGQKSLFLRQSYLRTSKTDFLENNIMVFSL